MPAAKSGNHIYVTSSPNTLASITTDINDTTFIEKTGSSPDIYTVKGNVLRYLDVRNGGVLTIGDTGDYSMNETLGFENLANDRTRFYINAGGELMMVGDTVIDFGLAGGFRPMYTYVAGKTSVLGNDTYKPVWQNYRRIYLYETSWTVDTYVNDIWHFEKMIIGSSYTANDYAFIFEVISKLRAHTFKSIIFDKSYGRGLNFYAVGAHYNYVGYDNLVFEGCNFEDVGNYPIYSAGGRIHVKNCTFGTTASWKLLFYRGQQLYSFTEAKYDFGYNAKIPLGQSFSFVEGCTFENENNKNIILVARGANVLLKNNEWQHDAAGDSLSVEYGGQALFWTGNTFTGGREVYDLNYAGYIQRVFALNLLVQDPDEAPIEDAIIHIAQNEGKERFTFITGSDGRIHTCWDLKAAFLTHQHQYGNNKVTNVEYWSDDSNSTYHDVWIYKNGYRAQHLEMVMDADKAETVTIFPQQKGFVFQW